MTIQTSIDQYLFSSALPDAIVVNGVTSMTSVYLYVGSDMAWSSELYANNGKVTLYNIRELIEEQIILTNEIKAVCSLTFTEGNSSVNSDPFTVIYSQKEMGAAGSYIEESFLSSRKKQRIYRQGKQKLYWAVYPIETMAYSIIATLRKADGTITDKTWVRVASSNVSAGLYVYTVDVPTIANHFASDGTLLAFSVYHGNRSMKFFVTDEPPTDVFVFNNNFNCDEYAPIWGTETEKKKMESVEAVCVHEVIKCDFKLEREFEVETALLSKEEADALSEMIISREVKKQIGANTLKKIWVEGESEVSDNLAAENRLKFTYKYARI